MPIISRGITSSDLTVNTTSVRNAVNKVFMCSETDCGHVFTTKTKLRNHAIRHREDRPYKVILVNDNSRILYSCTFDDILYMLISYARMCFLHTYIPLCVCALTPLAPDNCRQIHMWRVRGFPLGSPTEGR